VIASGQALYAGTCQVCHGADRRGVTGPELLSLKSKFTVKDFHQLINNGKGEMPAFPQLTETDATSLYTYITTASGPRAGGPGGFGQPAAPVQVTGPVVGSGGAPGGLDQRPVAGAGGSVSQYGAPYPLGTEAFNADRYFIPGGYGLSFSYIIIIHHQAALVNHSSIRP
jgi:quinoprotein glucose dehydrogenase